MLAALPTSVGSGRIVTLSTDGHPYFDHTTGWLRMDNQPPAIPGDMLKSVYDTNNDGKIDVGALGTGTPGVTSILNGAGAWVPSPGIGRALWANVWQLVLNNTATSGIVIGDSIAYGFSASTNTRMLRTYPDQLGEYIMGRGGSTNVGMTNQGVTGDRTTEALVRFQTAVLTPNPNFLVIALGTNDATGNNVGPIVPPAQFVANLETMVRLCFQQNIAVALATPPPKFDAPASVQAVRRYADLIRGVAAKFGCPLLDADANFQPTSEARGRQLIVAQSDGIHPTSDFDNDTLVAALFDGLALPEGDDEIFGVTETFRRKADLTLGPNWTPSLAWAASMPSPQWAFCLGGSLTVRHIDGVSLLYTAAPKRTDQKAEIAFRFSQSNRWVAAAINQQNQGSNAGYYATIVGTTFYVFGPGGTTLTVATTALTPGRRYTIGIERVGTVLTGRLDGVVVVTYTIGTDFTAAAAGWPGIVFGIPGGAVGDTRVASVISFNAVPAVETTGVRTVTVASNVVTTDGVLLANASGGAFTLTLPSAVSFVGRSYTVKKTDASVNAVTVATTSAQTIDGGLTAILSTQYLSLTVISDGSNWMVL